MSKKEKLKDIKNNAKAHKGHCQGELTACCFINEKVDADLQFLFQGSPRALAVGSSLKAHLKIDSTIPKRMKEELALREGK